MKIQGYIIQEKIYENQNTIIYRAIQENTQKSVIIKSIKKDFPSKREIETYEKEFEITSEFKVFGMLKSYSMEKIDNKYAIIFEDVKAISLKEFVEEKNLSFFNLVRVFVSIIKSLDSLHKISIVHKDINPSNLLIIEENYEIKIIDFGIAFVDSNYIKSKVTNDLLEGSLSYISPEQTGRLNLQIDYRSDYYSLGISFYELLAKKRPFSSKDSMELIHSHIAIRPDSPIHLAKIFYPDNDPELQILSKIILKLISKNPDDRYQSSSGILYDLEKILESLETGKKLENFEIGQSDFSSKFLIKNKLFGREKEFNEAINSIKFSKNQFLFLYGSQGSGKSFFVNDLQSELLKNNFMFISGKFDELNFNIPYSGIILAGKNFIQQLLYESEEEIKFWADNFQKILGHNLGLISEIIPEIELITGKAEKIEILDSNESINRFQQTIINFITCLELVKKRVIIFIDNIHLADFNSLSIMEKLLLTDKISNLNFIFTYRNQQTKLEKLRFDRLESIIEKCKNRLIIELKNLDIETVGLILAESLNQKKDAIKDLTEILYNKTSGNPFAMIEFLKLAYNEHYLYREKTDKIIWSYNLEQIKKLNITDNLVDLLVLNLKILNNLTLDILQEVSVFGMKFNINFVNEITGRAKLELLEELNNSVNQGILNTENIEYSFVHEKIHSAIYGMLSETHKEMLHGKIANYFLENLNDDQINDNIFVIANHINSGLKFLKPNLRNLKPVLINYRAGLRAKSSAAFQSAMNYFTNGMKIINDPIQINSSNLDEWKELKINLYLNTAETAFSNTDYDKMNSVILDILSQYKDVIVKAKAQEIKNKFYITIQKPLFAINETITLLDELGVPFPQKPDKLDILFSITKVKLLLKKIEISSLITYRETSNQNIILAMKLIASIGPAAYFTDSNLLPILILKNVYLSLKYGHSEISPFSYSGFGIILCGILGEYSKSYELGIVCLELINKPSGNKLKTKVLHMVNSFILHWKEHLRLTLPQLIHAYKHGIEFGDFEFAFYAAIQYSYHSFFSSSGKLEILCNEVSNYMKLMNSYNFKNSLYQISSLHITLNKLIDFNKKTEFHYLDYPEYEFSGFEKEQSKTLLFYESFFNMYSYFHIGQFEKAQQFANIAYLNKSSITGLAILPVFYMYYSLLLIFELDEVSIFRKLIHTSKINRMKSKLKEWAKEAPTNQQHRVYLIEAEIFRSKKDFLKAIEYYDLAIQVAKENEYINDQALANELAGKYLYNLGKKKLAEIYLRTASYYYQLWGAIGKSKYLNQKYPDIFADKKDKLQEIKSEITFRTNSEALNLNSIIKSTEAISKEIQLDRLLPAMVNIIIENVGAEKGIIVLNNNGKLYIEYESSNKKNEISLLRSIPIESGRLPRSLINYTLRSKETIIINDAISDERFYRDPYILDNRIKSILVYPIIKQDSIFGIIYLENNLSTYAFQRVSFDFLQAISTQARISIENAKLYSNMESKVQERTNELDQSLKQQSAMNQNLTKITKELNASLENIKKDLRLAKKIQDSILPHNLTEIQKLDIYSFYQPMETVGGDFYDIAEIGNNKIRIFLADATGHGIQGALVTMAIKSEYENLKNILSEPREILEFLNTEFYKKFQAVHVFFTCIVVDIDLENNTLKYSSAGHPAQILIQKNKKEFLTNSGKMIGLTNHLSYKQFELDFNKDSKLYLFTDGVFEQLNQFREEFGEEKLLDLIEKHSDLSSKKLTELLISEIYIFLDGTKTEDDITFISIKNRS